MSKVKQAVRAAAHTVRDHVSDIRAAVGPTTEYLTKTITGVVEFIDREFPESGLGESKLELAMQKLEDILGDDFVANNWPRLAKRIATIVKLQKLANLIRKKGA